MRAALVRMSKRFRAEWPTSAELYLPGGRVPELGELHKNPAWAATIKKALDAERKAKKFGRAEAIQAAVDFWYRGEVAEKIVAFMSENAVRDASRRSHRGLLTKDDFAAWGPAVEEPVSLTYRGLTVCKCGPWTQGPVFLQQLALLEGFDLKRLGHNSADYIHTVVESAKLAFADRERYYGDPRLVDVPLRHLLSREHSVARRKLIDPKRASLEMRPSDAPRFEPEELRPEREEESHDFDTTHTCAVDGAGNMMAATCSGGWIMSSPVIPTLGFPMGTRGQMFWLDPHHPNAVAPRKRPRTTLTPSLVLKDGQPWLVFGTPGGDQQDQWTLQFFLNWVDFKMNLQEAIDAATFHTTHFPSSFYPRRAVPGGLVIESRVPEATRAALAARGHKVTAAGPWVNGRVMAVHRAANATLSGAASPRHQVAYVTGD
jgi:gamma-glutamyltranspeptidase/glutathione hydrolase